jgi:transcription elongation GreA/GreB family factor
MSRAFVKESDVDTINLPDRSLSAQPNFVTPEGFAAIGRALNRFNAAHTAAVDTDDKAAIASARRELRYWAARRASAQVIEPPTNKNRVHFGATVTVRRRRRPHANFPHRWRGRSRAGPGHAVAYLTTC